MKDKRAKYKRKLVFLFISERKQKALAKSGGFISVERIEGSPLGEPSKRFLSIRHFPTFSAKTLNSLAIFATFGTFNCLVLHETV